jgi:hypothetical protein
MEDENKTSIALTERVNNTGRGSTYIIILGNKEVNVWELISKILLISVRFIFFIMDVIVI